MNYINTATGVYPVSESEIRAAFPNTSFPVPFVAPEGYVLVFPAPQPEFNPVTQRVQETTPMLTAKGHYEQQWEIVELEPEQIAINQEKKQRDEAAAIQNKIESLWSAADKYTSSFISGVAVGILTIGVMQQKPKALAVTSWSSAIWGEYYTRKSLVTLTSQDNHDFSSFGPMPYSVPELQGEIGL